jgi:hypothetical protein
MHALVFLAKADFFPNPFPLAEASGNLNSRRLKLPPLDDYYQVDHTARAKIAVITQAKSGNKSRRLFKLPPPLGGGQPAKTRSASAELIKNNSDWL